MAYNRKQRLNDNIKAIETAFILDREQRTPTARERLLLERYCGFGGLKCILNPARELADAVHWAKSDLELFAPTVELHRLIRENSKNESEYKQLMDSLKQSVLTAFYTPSAITEALADVLKEHQIIPEKVLEPSAGIGAFVDSVLDNNPKADIMAFEKDLLTGKILRHLHPEQKVRIEGFEKIEKPFNDYFDLAISNIPFGDVAVFDPSYTAMKGMRALVTRRIHNYFFVKALDTVRDGGLVAFITSQGVLNAKNNSAVRFMMLYHADLVSAIRLPNNLFTENANTEVGSDLIILQKNTQKESLRGDDNLLDTVYNDENRIPTNNYFLEHPERIIHLHTIAALHLKGNIISCVCTHRYCVRHLIIRIILIMRCIFSLGYDFRIHRKSRRLIILVPLCQSPNDRKYYKHCYQNKKYWKYRTHRIK